jgi:peptidoglycan hydrolase CwlO-like protein
VDQKLERSNHTQKVRQPFTTFF